MLRPPPIPGLLITGTDTDVGKTVIAGAIAACLRAQGYRIGVLKPAASGCIRTREGLVSEDAEFLAACADANQPLDIIAPQRFLEPLAPAIAAQRAGVTLDWIAVQRSIDIISRTNDVLIVEGVGGILVPMDGSHTMLDVAAWLHLPTVIVARPALGTINHTLLTIQALRSRNIPIAGVVINRYPGENPSVAEETNPKAIEKWGKAPVLCLTPNIARPIESKVPDDILAAISAVDWTSFLSR